MSEYIQIQWTCNGMIEAKRIIHMLFEKRLIACANLVPWIESYFKWRGKLELSQETKVLMKTTKEKFEEIQALILNHVESEVPEILIFEISGGNPAYLKWIDESVGS